MITDRRLIESFRMEDPSGYLSVRAVVRISAPILVCLLLVLVFGQAYDFYQYNRFDDASHRVPGLVRHLVGCLLVMMITVRFWFLFSDKK